MMGPTLRQGLRVLLASVLALGFGGCTFDQDELHGLPEAGVEVAVGPADVAADGRPDGGGIVIGSPDATRIDAGADVPMTSPLDAGEPDGWPIDGAGDVPLGGLDVAIDASPIDASAVDASAVDVARVEAARRDGPGRDG